MNTLKSTTQDGFSGEEWYTIEELAELTGMSVETLKKGNSPLSTFGIDFKVETKIKNMGGHRNVKLYSPNVLKALKEYQLKKSVPAATKTKGEIDITVEEKDGFQTVSARELYKALNITDRFSRWFDSLLKYGFVENEDFTSVKSSTLVNNGAERELQDYAITIDMAKQICMLQRSELGRKYREYLLKLEKAWNTPEAVMSRALQIANRTLEEAKRQVVFQQAIIEEQKPKVAVYNELVDRSKTLNFRDMAAKLGMKQSEFMNILKTKYIYKTPSGEYRAYADFQNYFTTKTFSRGVGKTGEQLLLNMEGVTYFFNSYKPCRKEYKNIQTMQQI